jgi:hypothetical protein
MSGFRSIEQVKRANVALGHHFFDPDTLRFFRSRVGSTVYGGRWFVTSEQGPGDVRRYTVREAMPDGSIATVEPFNALSYSEAHRRAASFAHAAERCQWFALCANKATTTEPHPVLGDVPICERCAARVKAAA